MVELSNGIVVPESPDIILPEKPEIVLPEFTSDYSGLKNYEFFVLPDQYELTNRQYEEWMRWARLVQWGRNNPIHFCEEIFGIEFMDYQRYAFGMSWNTPNVVWCMSRNGGKSLLGSIFVMAKTLLIPNHKSYILCGVGSQAVEMFLKIEQITKRSLSSFTTLTDIFDGELVKSNSNSSGFVHDPASYKFSLFNNSQVFTLNGAYDNNRSKRSNLNYYDEAMNSPDALFDTSEPFTTQDSSFKLGTGTDTLEMLSYPPPFQNQRIYASSAGRTDQYFFKKYRECSIRMDAGDKRYFCADISCDVILNATKRGEKLPVALLTQDTIDSMMRKNKESAMREYYNKFTSEGSDKQIIPRAMIIRNSYSYIPHLANDNADKFYVISYDPARRSDNSAVVIAEFFIDPDVGWKARIVNCITLMDRMSRKKIPMTAPNQVEELKHLIIGYNGEGVADYENIKKILVDAGSGGAGVPLTDFLCEDFEIDGKKHRGLVDDEFNEGDGKKFPNALKGVLQLISPRKHRSEMFEATIKMVEQNLIEFPEEYHNKGYINLIYEQDSKGNLTLRKTFPSEKEDKELKKKGDSVFQHQYSLSRDEEDSLEQIDMMKNEIVNIYRFKRGSGAGNDDFQLAPERANELNDDRCYAFVMICWYLSQLRREGIVKGRRPKSNKELAHKMPIKKYERDSILGKNNKSWR